MEFPDPLVRGTLVRRYKRFLADVELAGGEVVTAHCANPGSMLSVNAPGSEVWLSPARNPERKLRYTWELVRVGDGLVGINTAHPASANRRADPSNHPPCDWMPCRYSTAPRTEEGIHRRTQPG